MVLAFWRISCDHELRDGTEITFARGSDVYIGPAGRARPPRWPSALEKVRENNSGFLLP